MPERYTGGNVLDAALDRYSRLYEAGHRVVVSFSGGKDSTVALELAVMAARAAGRLPVEVVMRDEEILFPGTFEYAERVAQRSDVSFRWVVAHQPIVNIFHRQMPYFWVFDPLLEPDEWVRQPPSFAETIDDLNIKALTAASYYPPPDGRELFCVTGLRVAESINRKRGLYSSMGYTTKPTEYGYRYARPIYDWTDGDVWLAIRDHGWDYNSAYTALLRSGVSRAALRISPPTMHRSSLPMLQHAARLWPQWFDRVCKRLGGVRSAALFGKRAVEPRHYATETWRETFHRECIKEAPAWIAERAIKVLEETLRAHGQHSTDPLPDKNPWCRRCGLCGSYYRITASMYFGDPFSQKQALLPEVEPEFFRPGAGSWLRPKPVKAVRA